MKAFATVRNDVEDALKIRAPHAFSPRFKEEPARIPCGIGAIDELMNGGLAVGVITEFVGEASSGRTTAALACMAAITTLGSVCAWIDVSDALDPESTASNGVDLNRLLWVRCGKGGPEEPQIPAHTVHGGSLNVGYASSIRNTGGGSPHPRSEGRDMPQAISAMLAAHGGLYDHQSRRNRKFIGTPGAPNLPLTQRSEHREEQVNSDRLPPRRGANLAFAPSFAPRCAEPQPRRESSLPSGKRLPANVAPQQFQRVTTSPWQALDQAIRATDLLLQSGGFSAIVLDLGSVAPEFAWRIPLATWFRFRAACERTRVSLILLTQHPCARSAAELVVRLQPGQIEAQSKVMTGIRYRAATERNRSYGSAARVIPIRKPPAVRAPVRVAQRICMDAHPMNTPLYVCVHVPEFPAQALLRLRPELARTPAAVLAGDAPLETVCSANAQAFRLGVTQGMTRAELDSFTGLTLLKRSELEERSARAALLEAAGAFTPRVEIQPARGFAFDIVLDMAGSMRLFGTSVQVVSSIAQALTALSFFVQLAASANLHSAVCMAPAARKFPIIIPYGKERENLSHLPLAALNLTAQQMETLELWGLRTVGELAVLPEVELIVRLGQQGKRLRLLARGEHPHLMVPAEPLFTLEEFRAFDNPVELLDSLLFVVGPMLDQLLMRAQNRAFALASLTVKLSLEGGGEHTRTLKPALPVMQREVLLKLLHLDLQANPPPVGIVSLRLHAKPGDRSKVQLGLFAQQLPEPLRLDVTLARIAALVGEDRVGSPRLLDTHRPDSFTMQRFTVSTAPAQKRDPQCGIALRRCRPPQALIMQHAGPRPAAFSLQGKRYNVEEAFGPWRKSGQWWSADIWSHEEWDIRATTTNETLLCLITHDLLRHHWQLEALYD